MLPGRPGAGGDNGARQLVTFCPDRGSVLRVRFRLFVLHPSVERGATCTHRRHEQLQLRAREALHHPTFNAFTISMVARGERDHKIRSVGKCSVNST